MASLVEGSSVAIKPDIEALVKEFNGKWLRWLFHLASSLFFSRPICCGKQGDYFIDRTFEALKLLSFQVFGSTCELIIKLDLV
jgi:hypothetical protein